MEARVRTKYPTRCVLSALPRRLNPLVQRPHALRISVHPGPTSASDSTRALSQCAASLHADPSVTSRCPSLVRAHIHAWAVASLEAVSISRPRVGCSQPRSSSRAAPLLHTPELRRFTTRRTRRRWGWRARHAARHAPARARPAPRPHFSQTTPTARDPRHPPA